MAEQAPLVANLLELYIHDFSGFLNLELGADGRFGYSPLPLYWSEPGRHPFLIRVDAKLAGLVFVKKGSQVLGDGETWDMAEFFVLRGYRKRGVGTRAAHEVWKLFQGRWEVRVMHANVAARHFWARAVSAFTGEAAMEVMFEKDGRTWSLFSFESGVA
jgi:predicted acetyltransferase